MWASIFRTSCSGPSGTPPNIGGGAGRAPRAVSFASSLSPSLSSLSLSAIMRPATRGWGGTSSLAAAASAARRRCASSKIRITSPRRPGLASSAGGDGGAAGEASSEMVRRGGNRTSKRESSVAPAGIVALSTLPSGAVKAASEPGPMPGGTRTLTWPGGTGVSPMWT